MNDHQAAKIAEKENPTRLERHSGTGRTGEPRKGGHGKYAWGTPGSEVDPNEILADVEAEVAADQAEEEDE